MVVVAYCRTPKLLSTIVGGSSTAHERLVECPGPVDGRLRPNLATSKSARYLNKKAVPQESQQRRN